MDYYEYIASREWALIKNKVKARADGACERCCQKTARIQVHHLTYERLGRELMSDLQGLCPACHMYLSAKSDVDPVKELAQPLTKLFLRAFKVDDIDRQLTSEIEAFLENNRTPRKGFSRKFLEAIGVSWPPPKGWKKDLISKENGYSFIRRNKCSSANCSADIEWFETPKGKLMPVDAGTKTPHWGTCKDVDKFRSRKK